MKLNIGDSFINTARRGQSANLSRVWGNAISLTYINPTTRPEMGGMTFGMTATYGPRFAGYYEDRNVGLEGGQIVRVGERVCEIITAPDVGFLIQNAVDMTANVPFVVPYEPPRAA